MFEQDERPDVDAIAREQLSRLYGKPMELNEHDYISRIVRAGMKAAYLDAVRLCGSDELQDNFGSACEEAIRARMKEVLGA